MQRGVERCRCGLFVALALLLAHEVYTAAPTTPTTSATRPTARAATPRPRAATVETTVTGALVWMDSDSPYYAAGLRSGDLIVRAGGKPIANDGEFYRVFAATTTTAQIQAEVIRGDQTLFVTVPAYLPSDVSPGSYRWDWARYLKYHAPDPKKPDPLLRRAYEDFDYRRYAQAQIEFTSATRAGHKDPLTLTKLAWLLLSRPVPPSKTAVEMAGKLLDQAMQAFDESVGDKDTQAKLEGTYMIYCKELGNITQAAPHGRKAIQLAPDIVGNRINYHDMLVKAENYDEAAMVADALAADYPRSIYFQRLKRTANLRINRMKGVIEAAETLVRITPDDIPTRLQLLPYLDRIGDTYNMGSHCDFLLRAKEKQMTDLQRGQVYYYQSRVGYLRRTYRAAERDAREAIRLRGSGEDHFLLANILHGRGKWRDAVIYYVEAQRKSWTTPARDSWRELRTKMDQCVEHLWSWQIKKLPPHVQSIVKARRQYLDERAVLKQSYVMRNRYAIRNALVVVGILMIFSGLALRFFVSD